MTVPEPVPPFEIVNVLCGAGENVAVTEAAEVPWLKLQLPVPEQAPLQPANTEAGEDGVAVRMTPVPVFTDAEQVPGQLMPLPVTVPEPVPARVTFTGNDAGMKLAVTDWAELMVTEQEPVPEHAPLQPANTDAEDVGVAVRVVEFPEL